MAESRGWFYEDKKPGPWAAQSPRSPYIGPPCLPRTPGLLCVSSMDAQFPVGSLGRGKKGGVLSAMPAGCPCLHSVLLAWGKPVMTVAVSGRRFHSARCETPRRGGVQRDEHPGTKKMTRSPLDLAAMCNVLLKAGGHPGQGGGRTSRDIRRSMLSWYPNARVQECILRK